MVAHAPRKFIHWKIEKPSGLISSELLKGKQDRYVCTTNLRAFYIEMHEILREWGFSDMQGDIEEQKLGTFFNGQAKKGEFVEPTYYENRSPDMYEKKFMWSTKADKTVEMEYEWYARYKTPHSEWGWVEIKIYLVCRRITNKEVLEGNTKKILQYGSWEFRNEFVYKNSIIPNYLNKIPIIKNSENLKEIYIHNLYEETIEEDMHFCQKEVMPLIKNIMNKYFVNEQ